MKQLSVFLIFFVLILFFAQAAQAITVFNNFGPGDTYNTSIGWFLSGSGTIFPESAAAMGFTPSVTADLESIDFAIGLFPSTNDLSFSLVNDFSNAPDVGSALESWTFTNLGSPPNELTADSVLNPLLQAGVVYWLVAITPTDGTTGLWNFNSIGDTGPVSGSSDGGFTWSAGTSGPRGVFRVNASSVPEPSSLFLLAAGLAGVGFLRRKLRQ